MEPRQPSKTELLLAAASTLAMMWCMLPAHQQKQLAMRATAWAQRLAARLAHAEGHAGMGDELAGHGGQARQRYSLAYRLSRLRDQFGQQLDRMRP
jgi:hypothetical protein